MEPQQIRGWKNRPFNHHMSHEGIYVSLLPRDFRQLLAEGGVS